MSTTVLDSIKSLPWDLIVANLSKEAPGILNLLEAICYVLGIFFTITALLQAAKAGNPQARMDHGKQAWVWSLAAAVLFMAFPTTVATLSTTLFGVDAMTQDNPFSYLGNTVGTGKLAGLLPILQIIGIIAVMRGLIVWRNVGLYGNGSRANATFSRGLVLLVSGVLLVNLKKTLGVVAGITGLNIGMGLF
jgi:hypothetical protein